jgi:predicted alpha/beta superfamily hydrolase
MTIESKQKINQLKIELHTDPTDDSDVFISGNFNNWKHDISYKMLRIAEGHYEFTFDDIENLPQEMEYKYTRGSWQSAEADNFGCKAPNRSITKNQAFISDYVPRWFQNGKSFKEEYLPKIHVIDEAFNIPQLNKTRRVQILLPCDYDSTTRRYPVIYLQDGQNLCDWNAAYGNWAIDEKLAVLKEYGKGDIIVVAIDHGEVSRINEFTPRNEISLGIGQREGALYLKFMVETLKPFVDENYRTLTQSKYTGIGGSSMGGLISLFGGVLHPETFGKVMVFSPSLWIYNDVYEEVKEEGALKNVELYIYAGGRESKGMLPNLHKLMTNIYASNQNTTINLVVNPNGTHSESNWSVAFPEAMEWLFY